MIRKSIARTIRARRAETEFRSALRNASPSMAQELVAAAARQQIH